MPMPLPVSDELMVRVWWLTEQVREAAQRVIDGAVRAVRVLPPFLADGVLDLVRALGDLVRRLLSAIAELSEPMGRPKRVWETGRRWVEDFAGPLSDHIGKIDPDHLAAAYEWQGRAAGAYEAAAARQRAALTALRDIGADVDVALARLAIGICGFWAAVAATLASALVQLIGAGVAVGTGVGTPAAVILATTCVATACAGVAGGAAATAALIEWVSDTITTLRGRIEDHEAFPDGAWPAPAVAHFDDGSMSDGTPSQWRLQQ